MARAACVGVPRAGSGGRGEERRVRDCMFGCFRQGLSQALGGHSNIMHDVCDAFLCKNLIVTASSDSIKPKIMLN